MTSTGPASLPIRGMTTRRSPAPLIHALAADGPAHRAPLPADAGGKARGLERIAAAGLRTAPWFVIPARARPADDAVRGPLRDAVLDACRALQAMGTAAFAVRSSGLDEDGPGRSFAGQYETVLDVPDADAVLEAIPRCWASADAPSVAAYRAATGLTARPPGIAVIVQAMVDAAFSGVAFSRSPAPGDGPDDAVVVATRGAGAPLVSGRVDGDEYRVGPDGTVEVRRIGMPRACRTAAPAASPSSSAAPAGTEPRYLDDAAVRAIAGVARMLEHAEGSPQDVEWAITGAGELYVLQTRPITASRAPDAALGAEGAIRVWDSANIVESFSGVTLPLTYSVARESYAAVYRGACRALGVAGPTLEANADVFDQMIGHLDGRVYYNVTSWHRVLSLLPGFGANQQFLERMMGARRPGGGRGERAGSVHAGSPRLPDLVRIAGRSGAGFLMFEPRARAFEREIRRLEREDRARDLDALTIDELLAYYDATRARALAGWHVTIFNDLAVMIVHGLLRRAAEQWLGSDATRLVNGLLQVPALAATVPADELGRIAERLRAEPAWRETLAAAQDPYRSLRDDPALGELRHLFDAYLERWGDRCPSELQLDRSTFREDPGPLLSIMRGLAAAPGRAGARPAVDGGRAPASAEIEAALSTYGRIERRVRMYVLRTLAAMTRHRLAWRERTRFARTEVFAVARRIFRSMGRRFVAAGLLDDPGDLHYLDIAEIRGAVRGTLPPVDLRALVQGRRALFAQFAAQPAPPARFETAGPVAAARRRTGPGSPARVARRCMDAPGDEPAGRAGDAWPARGGTSRVDSARIEMTGTPVWAGRVRAACHPVEDPRAMPPDPGSIVAARTTDPGWVPLLLSAAGLLVEHGSVLSHSAIVAREIGLPTIVGIDGLMAAVSPGASVEMDGSTGRVGVTPARARGDAR